MQSFFKENKSAFEIQQDKKAQEYINKYLKEVQRHFDMSDRRMRFIIYKIYKELSPSYFIKVFVKNKLDMLKSFCYKKFRKYH